MVHTGLIVKLRLNLLFPFGGCVSTLKMQAFESREIPLISKTMKKLRFTEVQVVQALQKHESGVATGVKP